MKLKLTKMQVDLIVTALNEYSSVCIADCEYDGPVVDGYATVKLNKKSGLYKRAKSLDKIIDVINEQKREAVTDGD